MVILLMILFGVVFNQIILEESVEERDNTLLKDIMVPVHKISENVPVSAFRLICK